MSKENETLEQIERNTRRIHSELCFISFIVMWAFFYNVINK